MSNLRWIPIAVIQYSIKHRLVNSLKVLVCLKSISDGYLHSSQDLILRLSELSGFTTKTIKNHLTTLEKIGWISLNSNIYYLRSWDFINCAKIKSPTNRRVEYYEGFLTLFRSYVIGAFIGHLSFHLYQKKIAETFKARELRGGRSYQRAKVSAFMPVATSYIAKILQTSTTTAHNYKVEACKGGFIKIESQLRLLKEVPKDLKMGRQLGYYKNYIFKKGRLYSRLPDLVAPRLKYKRGGKKVKYIRVVKRGRGR